MGLAALVTSAALLINAGRGLSFYQDDWSFVPSRLGWDADTFLKPHNEHLTAFPILVYKALFAIVGLTPYWPYRLVVVGAHLLCAALLFTIARRRHGPFVAACAVLPLLAFGAAWEDTLWPFSIGWVGSVVSALGALLCLDRGDRRGDVAACALVILSLACISFGISVALGVLVELLWDQRRWRRIWVAAVPVGLYAAWYLTYNLHPNRAAPLDYAHAPWFAVRSAFAAVGGYLGVGEETLGTGQLELFPRGDTVQIAMGALTIALAAGGIWLVARRGRLTPRVAMVAVTLVTYWAFLGITRASTNAPYISRYIYPGAVFSLLLALEIAPRGRVPLRLQAALAVVAAAAAGLSVSWLQTGSLWFRDENHVLNAELGALQVARGHVDPKFFPDPQRAATLTAGDYFAAIDKLGPSAAETPKQLEDDVEPARLLADDELVRAEVPRPLAYTGATRRYIEAVRHRPVGLRLDPTTTSIVRRQGSCLVVTPRTVSSQIDLTVPTTGVVAEPSADDTIRIQFRRFAAGFGVAGNARAWSRPVFVATPADTLPLSWHLRIWLQRPAMLC